MERQLVTMEPDMEPDYSLDDHKDNECMICLNLIEDDDYIYNLECGHAFHCECLEKWYRRRAICPLCKQQLKAHKTALCDYHGYQSTKPVSLPEDNVNRTVIPADHTTVSINIDISPNNSKVIEMHEV
ncbi:hypothetical protein WA158_002263 [Blastocystis sp. Blastoise]